MADDPLEVLARAADQAAALLGEVRADDLDRPTPCHDWAVARLVDHLVAAPARFVSMMHGEQPDFSDDPAAGDDPAAAFRAGADRLVEEWGTQEESARTLVDWQTAELTLHSWDLARGLGRPTDTLDDEAASRALAFMRAHLTPENRAPAFDPERPAPPDAPEADRLAAFAGREV